MFALARSEETLVVSCSCGSQTRVYCGTGVSLAGRVACRTCGEAAEWDELLSRAPADERSAEIVLLTPRRRRLVPLPA